MKGIQEWGEHPQAGARQGAWLEDCSWAEGAESRLGKKWEQEQARFGKDCSVSKPGGWLFEERQVTDEGASVL